MGCCKYRTRLIGITLGGSTTQSSIVSFAVIQVAPVVRAAPALDSRSWGHLCARHQADRSLWPQALFPEVFFSVKLPIAG